MLRPRFLVKPLRESTRLLLLLGQTELLHAVLPASGAGAAPMLCKALALWFGRPLSIVLYAVDRDASCELGLCDGFGTGLTTAHYEVEVIDPRLHRRGLGSFRDLRRLALRGLR